jgi:hypothetical protein
MELLLSLCSIKLVLGVIKILYAESFFSQASVVLPRPPPLIYTVDQKIIFNLVEEENSALLLHLPELFAETAVFGSAVGLGCWLVETTPQGLLY